MRLLISKLCVFSLTLVIFTAGPSIGFGQGFLVGETVAGEVLSEEDIEALFNDLPEEKALRVNEGDLVFLSKMPPDPVHHIHNTFTIDKRSLDNGWVKLIQCHDHLDAVPASQIVYRYKNMNMLRIESYTGIEKAWIDGNSVQLENIGQKGKVCVRAEVKILKSVDSESYVLRNGPFHRKFLDGYYPMQVTLVVHYPSDILHVRSIKPALQKGFTLQTGEDEITVNAIFEGKLITEIHFSTGRH